MKKTPQGKYDSVDGSANAIGGGNKRRQAVIETTEESGSAGQLTNTKRLMGVNLARDLERNYGVARSLFKQLRNNVVGALAKIQVNTKDKFGAAATEWFNKDFFNNCDFRSTEDFSKICRNVVTAKKREGDVLVVFDDGIFDIKPGGTGKIICYESDMLAELSDKDKLPVGATQEAGVLRDKYGREIGYVVSKKRGQASVASKDATVFARNPDDEAANSVKLIKSTFRVNQGRGTADMLSATADLLDCYEMRSKELQSAKAVASMAITVEREEGVEDFDDPRLDPTNENPDDSAGASSTLPENNTELPNYDRLESLTGGNMEYLAKGDKMTLLDPKRPNLNMGEFIDQVTDSAGAAFGFAHAYARMKADTSYTAFRGDMVLTWVSLYVEQKDLEREFLDWVAVRAINWALKTGKIIIAPAPGWEKKISWHMPTMPFVDELKERQANATGLKNGEIDFSQILGPNWRETFDALAEQINYAREKGLPLSVFEQKSGGMAAASTTETVDVEDDDTPDESTGDNEDEQT